MTTGFETLQELISVLDDAPGVTELTINGPNGAQITIKRSPQAVHQSTATAPLADATESETASDGVLFEDEGLVESRQSLATASITANRVGIFHTAKPAVDKESAVAVGQIVGYIESMKLMNEVRSDATGIVTDALAKDGIPVEYGQPLFRLAASTR